MYTKEDNEEKFLWTAHTCIIISGLRAVNEIDFLQKGFRQACQMCVFSMRPERLFEESRFWTNVIMRFVSEFEQKLFGRMVKTAFPVQLIVVKRNIFFRRNHYFVNFLTL